MLHRKKLCFVFAGVIPLLVCGCAANRQDTVNIRTIEYRGWADSVELTNDTVRVVVVPAIGRIMSYGFIDSENVLYENPAFFGRTLKDEPLKENGRPIWAEFGGDRIWPTEESKFIKINGRKRPPDHWLDGLPWQGKLVDDGVVITSSVSDYCGARVKREIKLAPTGTTVVIHQRMEKVKPGLRKKLEPMPLTIWNISRVASARQNLFSLNTKSSFKDRALFYKWDDYDNRAQSNFKTEGDIGFFPTDPVRMQKIGADSPAWIAAVTDKFVMAEFFPYDPLQKYPDGGTSAAIFTCPEFSELECLSPLKELEIGESIEHEITWQLFRLPAEITDPSEKTNLAIQWLNSSKVKTGYLQGNEKHGPPPSHDNVQLVATDL